MSKKPIARGTMLCLRTAILTAALTTASYGGIQVSCSGPGGYCGPGSTMTLIASSSKLIPNMTIEPNYQTGTTTARIRYCSSGDGITCDACSDGSCFENLISFVPVPDSSVTGSTPWSTLDGIFNTTRPITKHLISRPFYCIAAYLNNAVHTPFVIAGYDNDYVYPINYECVAKAPPPPPPDLCTVVSPNPITVEFGSVERSTIAVGTGGGGDILKTLTIQCMGPDTHGITVRLAMIPTTWSNGLIATSHPSLGVGISADGQPLNNNDSFTMNVNGSGTANFRFSLLRDPNKQPADIATGNFCASATLIVTEP